MNVFELEPEVPGSPGPDTVWDTTVVPPRLSNVSLEFDGWLGDDLVETYPIYAVTDRLRAALEGADVTGVAFEEMSVSKSDQFQEFFPERALGRWSRMFITGSPVVGDAWMSEKSTLIVSPRFWLVLSQFNLENCEVAEISA
jgi:hypothetical protein